MISFYYSNAERSYNILAVIEQKNLELFVVSGHLSVVTVLYLLTITCHGKSHRSCSL